jgi:MFS transporter, FSR family, fosmidomycin resistance protein
MAWQTERNWLLMNKFDWKVLLLLSLGHCVTDIYQGSLPVLLPFLKAKLDLSYTTAGMILIASNVASSVVQPVFGYYSDRKGKPFLLPFGCLCAGAGFGLLSLPSSYAVILLLVLASGLGIAAYHPEGFKTASYFTGKRPAAGMSIFAVGGNLGFALAPIFTLFVVTHYGLDYLPVMAGPAFLFVILLFIFWKKISIEDRVTTTGEKGGKKTVSKSAYTALALVIAAVVMRAWIQFGLISYVPFYYIDHLKGDPLYAGQLLTVFLISGVVGTLAGAQIADRWGHKKLFAASMGISSLILPLIFFTTGFMLMVVFALLGFFLISSFAVTTVMSQKLLPNNIGMASGLTVGFAIGTGGVGVTILGVIADNFGVPAALQCIAVLPVIGFLICLMIKYPSHSYATKALGTVPELRAKP